MPGANFEILCASQMASIIRDLSSKPRDRALAPRGPHNHTIVSDNNGQILFALRPQKNNDSRLWADFP